MEPSRPATGEARRAPRWIARAAAIAGAAGVVAFAAGALVVHELDAPWLKSRLLSLVRARSGLELDYRAVRLRPLSGVVVEGVVVRTPPPLRDLAPALARIGRLELAWSPASLLGRGPRIERVALDDVALTLATDEHGQSSLQLARPPAAPSRPSPRAPVPTSRLLAELLSSAPPAARVEVSGLSVAIVRGAGGVVADRFELRGLSLRADAVRAGPAFRLRVAAGTPSAPLRLDLARSGRDVRPAAARLEAALAVEAAPAGVDASADLRVLEQTFAPAAVRELLHLEASAAFDAPRGRTDSVLRVRAADGAAALEAELALLDGAGASAQVRQARGHVDLERLLRLVPAGLVVAHVGRGELHWRAEEVEVGAPYLARGGSIVADGELHDARVSLPGVTASLASARLAVRASAGPGGEAELRARGLRLDAGPRHVAADGLDARASGLRLGSGVLELSGELASLSAQAPAGRVVAERARWRLAVPLRGDTRFTASLDAPVERLRAVAADGRTLLDGPARVGVRASGIVPDLARPAASRAVADVSIALATLAASLHVVKQRDTAEVELHAALPDVASFHGARGGGAGRAPAPLELSSRARFERLLTATPTVEQRTTLRVGKLAWGGLLADGLTADVRSSGDALRQRVEADLRVHALRGAGAPAGDEHLAATAQLDLSRPAAELRLTADGAAAGTVDGSVAFDRARGALRWQLDGTVERVAALARLAAAAAGADRAGALSGLELEKVAVSARGDLLGVVAAGAGGLPRLVPDPLRTASGSAAAELRATGVAWRSRQAAVAIPSARWRATLRAEGPRRSVESVAELYEAHVVTGAHRVDATGVVHRLSATTGAEPLAGELEAEQRLELASLRQDVAAYPVEGARVVARARRDRDGVWHLSELRAENAAGGTTLAAHGIVDVGGLRRRLTLAARLEQDVARAWSAPASFAGDGRVTADLEVESPDLVVFRTRSAVRFEHVNARAPGAGVVVEALDGEVPLFLDVAVRGGRASLLRQSRVNPYPTLRFADQHPLMTRGSFLSIARLTTPMLSAAPLAGNVEVEQNLISVSQLEMGVRGGEVTGACLVDWDGPRTTLEARVRATGVLSSRGEPFDGNVAVVVSAADRSVNGRAEILRIGRRHLLDLLDLEDPHRTNAAANRVRHALALGYPDRVRVSFDHGFASARVTFGGLARLVQLDELRGLPMGPLVDRVLSPLSRAEDQP